MWMAIKIIWEFRGKNHFTWLQNSGGNYTEVCFSKASAEEEAGKSETVHWMQHEFFKSTKSAHVMHGEHEDTPAVGLKLVTFNVHGSTDLSLKLNPTSWWSREQVHWLSSSLCFEVIQLPHLAGKSREKISTNWYLAVQAVWTKLSQGSPLRTWAWDQLSEVPWVHYPVSQRVCK